MEYHATMKTDELQVKVSVCTNCRHGIAELQLSLHMKLTDVLASRVYPSEAGWFHVKTYPNVIYNSKMHKEKIVWSWCEKDIT